MIKASRQEFSFVMLSFRHYLTEKNLIEDFKEFASERPPRTKKFLEPFVEMLH